MRLSRNRICDGDNDDPLTLHDVRDPDRETHRLLEQCSPSSPPCAAIEKLRHCRGCTWQS